MTSSAVAKAMPPVNSGTRLCSSLSDAGASDVVRSVGAVAAPDVAGAEGVGVVVSGAAVVVVASVVGALEGGSISVRVAVGGGGAVGGAGTADCAPGGSMRTQPG